MEQIVEEMLAGEKGAVTRFYREYSPYIKAYLTQKMPSQQDTQEMLQDVFMSAIESLPLFRGQSSLKTWLYSIARHEVADFYRKRYVRRIVEKTTPLFDDVVSMMSTPEFEMKKNKIRNKFYGAYKELSKQHQDIISYRYELGMSVKEIAKRMEMSVKATESMLYRARQAFMVAYGE